MPDVGVLNLQIHSESTQAENSLRRLEGALLAIKKATGETGLNKTVNALQRLKSAVNFETIGNLHALAAALNQVKRACDFTVPNLSGLNRFRQSVERMRSSAASIGQMRNSVNDFTEGFATAEARVSGATSKVNEFGNAMDKVFSMVGNGKFEQFNRMFDAWEKMRSAKSLGAGENTGVSTSVEKGWTAWKNGAIEVEGTVSDAMENIVGYIESAGEKVQSGNETVANAFRQTGTSVSEMRMRTEIYFSSIKNRIAELNEQWIGAIQKARELGESMKKIYETPGVSDSKKKEAFAEYKTATDNVRALLEEMKAVDQQATETAQKLGISYESITASVERHTQAVYEDARQQMKAVNTQKHFEYQTRHLDYYQQNLASMSELDKKNFKEMYANDPAMTSAIEQIERMAAAQGNLNDEQSRATGAYGIDTKAIENGIAQLGEARQRITQINKDFEEAVKRMEETGGVMPRFDTSALDQAYNDVTAFVDNMSMQEASVANTAYEYEDRIRALAAAEEDMKNKMAAAVAGGAVQSEAMARYAVAIRLVRGEQEQLLTQLVELQQKQSVSGRLTEAVKADFEVLGSVVKKILSPLKNLARQFVNIAKRMAIRAVIRQFTDGIREGVENMYWWSKANNTDFAPSLDHLATSLKDLTNSLGAMAAEVLTAVMPVLEQIIDKVIEGVNWLNQFFAALQGKNTWMKYERGSETTKMFDDTKKAASGASKAMKELLADWDELNIIQSESSRGGGSGSSYKWSEENTGKYTETPIGSGPAAAAGWVKNNWGWVVGAGVVGAAGLATLKGFIKNFIFKNKVERIVQDILEKNDLTGKNGEKTGMEKAKQAAEEAKETTEQAKQATEQAKDAVDEATSKVDEVIEQNKPEHLAEVTVEKAKIEDATVERLLDKTEIKRLEAGSDTPSRPLGLDDVQQNAKRLMDATLNNNVLPNTDISRTLDLVEKGLNKTIPSLNQENISYLKEGIARLTEGSKLPPAQESAQQNIQLNAAQTVLDITNKLIDGAQEVSESAKLLAKGAEASAKTVNIDGVDTVKLNSGEALDSSLANNKEYMALREKVADALGDQWGSIGVEGAAERRLAIAESRLQDAINRSDINTKEEVKRLMKTGWDKETATKDVTDRVKIAEMNRAAAMQEVETAGRNVELAHEFNEMTHNLTGTTMDQYAGNPVYPRNWQTMEEIAQARFEESRANFPNLLEMVAQEETKQYAQEVTNAAWDRINEAMRGEGEYGTRNAIPLLESEQETLDQIRKATEESAKTAGATPAVVGAVQDAVPNIAAATANVATTAAATEQAVASLNATAEAIETVTRPAIEAGNAANRFARISGETTSASAATVDSAATEVNSTGLITVDLGSGAHVTIDGVEYQVGGMTGSEGFTGWTYYGEYTPEYIDFTTTPKSASGANATLWQRLAGVSNPMQYDPITNRIITEDALKYGFKNLDMYYKGGGVFEWGAPHYQTTADKVQGYTYAGESWLAEHSGLVMAALVALTTGAQYSAGKYEEENAYKEFYGERYTNLSPVGKGAVRYGATPEYAAAITSMFKDAYEKSGIGGLYDITEWLYGAAHDTVVATGSVTKPVIDLVNDVTGTLDYLVEPFNLMFEKGKVGKPEEKGGITESRYLQEVMEFVSDPRSKAIIEVVKPLASAVNSALWWLSPRNSPGWTGSSEWVPDYSESVAPVSAHLDELVKWLTTPGNAYDQLSQSDIEYYVPGGQLRGIPFDEDTIRMLYESMLGQALNYWDNPFGEEDPYSSLEYYLYNSGFADLFPDLVDMLMKLADEEFPVMSSRLAGAYIAGTPQEMGYSGFNRYAGEEGNTAKDVQDGTKAANAELESEAAETNRLLRLLLAKNLTVNLQPSSTFGRFQAMSSEAFSTVTGV